jgi:branched-chain amino acid transport system ATP-binding protein
MTAPLLAVDNIGCKFGGFIALEGVTTTFQPGKVTSIIGPNGAGKSTFFNLLSGVLTPSSGSIRFKGREMAGTPQHKFVHLGIARSYQITNIFPDLSVHENVRVAAQATAAGSSRYNIWTNRNSLSELSARADAALESVGLIGRRNDVAKFLAHGQQRALEVAISVISDPDVLLLDEPTAGMGPEETKEMVALLEKLAAQRTILLVEHKMKMILGLSDRILVLHHGRLIADGSPQDIQTDPEVRRVYLGQNDGYA